MYHSLELASVPSAIRTLVLAAMLLACRPWARSATLTGSFATVDPGTTIDLSAEGQLDWADWGFVTEWSFNHKYGVTQQISYSFITDTKDGYSYTYPDGPWALEIGTTGFAWTNGTPARSSGTTTNGIYIFGDKLTNNTLVGFQIQCAADTTPKILKVYVGTSGDPKPPGSALTEFSASLGTLGYANDSLTTATGAMSGVFTVNFQADSPGQLLTVNFNCNDTSEFIFLQAATLAGTNLPPGVTIAAPADGANFSAPATFSVNATAADNDGTVTNLMLLNGPVILGQSASGALTVPMNNQAAGTYNFLAVATDDSGLSITSFPTRVYVTTAGGTLIGHVDTPPLSVNLTAEGTNDWAHWGLNSATNFDRKAGVNPQIPNFVLFNASTNELTNYAGNLTAYSWSDGTPTAAAVGTDTGVFLYATNDPPAFFQLTVPATNLLRRLKVFVGLSRAQGRLDAWLSDFSALPYSDSSVLETYSDAGQICSVYTLTFASPNPGANLIVTWTPVASFDANFGNLTWQAATLSPPPPPPLLQVVNPPANQFTLWFYANAGANYAVLYSDSLSPSNWQALTNFPGADTNAFIVDPGMGSSHRFYRVEVH
jgi:hypothetical protein